MTVLILPILFYTMVAHFLNAKGASDFALRGSTQLVREQSSTSMKPHLQRLSDWTP